MLEESEMYLNGKLFKEKLELPEDLKTDQSWASWDKLRRSKNSMQIESWA